MSQIGEKLRDLAFQRRPEHYQDILEFLFILQNRRINHQILDGDDYEAIEIAQTYLREVPDPKESTLNEKRRSNHDVLST